jgi:hypothetical protein
MVETGGNVYDAITGLFFELGFVPAFDNNGVLTAEPLFNTPGSADEAAQIFDGGNIRGELDQTAKEEKYGSVVSMWRKIEHHPAAMVFRDNSKPDGIHQTRIEIQPGAYYKDAEWVYLELDSEEGDVVFARNFNFSAVVYETGITFRHTVEDGRPMVSFYNGTTITKRINKFEVYAEAFIKSDEIHKTGKALIPGKLLEIENRYITEEEAVKELVERLTDYYRYADFTVKLKSDADFPLGSFVKVSEDYMGTVIGRITQKTVKLFSPIEYEVEAVSEYIPSGDPGSDLTVNGRFGHTVIEVPADNIPPSAPEIVDSSVDTAHGEIAITFTESYDENGVAFYRIYRKLAKETHAKVVYTITPPQVTTPEDNGRITFIDDGARQYAEYSYKITAVDKAGNESAPSNELLIASSISERPLPPLSVKAAADNADYIFISVVRRNDLTDDRLVAASWAPYISRDGGETYSPLLETAADSFSYFYDRRVDGYPEKEDLAEYRFKVFAKSKYNQYSERGVEAAPALDGYLGWQPVDGAADPKVRQSGRAVSLCWDSQPLYGNLVYEVQIAKQLQVDNQNIITDLTDGGNWRAPAPNDALIYELGPDFQALLDRGDPALNGYRYHYGGFKQAWSGGAGEYAETGSNIFNLNLPLDQEAAAGAVFESVVDGGTAGAAFDGEAEDGGAAGTAAFAGALDNGGAAENWDKERAVRLECFAVDTVYYFRVRGREKLSGKLSNWLVLDPAAAAATSARDVVNNAIKGAQLAPGAVTADKIDAGAVTADKIFVKELAAISALLGVITGGELKGDADNYWSLDGTDGKTAGELKIGDGNENILWYKPGTGLTIKTSRIFISALGTSVKGNFYVEDDTSPVRLLDVNAANNTVTVGAEADSANKNTGALSVKGGAGIGKSLNVGGAVAAGAVTADTVTAGRVTMTGKPPASGGTLLEQASGYTKKTITLSSGWYYADVSGAGGGGGSRNGKTGGSGGKLKKVFFVSYSVEAVLAGGAGGSGGQSGAGGGVGGSSSLFIPELGILFCASGGGGGGSGMNSTNAGAGGGGGAIGSGGGGSQGTGSGSAGGGGSGFPDSGPEEDGNGFGGKHGIYSGGIGGNGGTANNITGGKGGDKNQNGYDGGNNFDDTRGGGASGGANENTGGNGYVTIYKL